MNNPPSKAFFAVIYRGYIFPHMEEGVDILPLGRGGCQLLLF